MYCIYIVNSIKVNKMLNREQALKWCVDNWEGWLIILDEPDGWAWRTYDGVAELMSLNLSSNEDNIRECEWKEAKQQPCSDSESVFAEGYNATITMPALRNKYKREIKPGVWVDVYDVLNAFDPDNRNAADDHAIKKMLLPGKRGVKDAKQDREEAIKSLTRSLEILG